MCPSCHSENTQVLRTLRAGPQVLRRRACLDCLCHFRTTEQVDARIAQRVRRAISDPADDGKMLPLFAAASGS